MPDSPVSVSKVDCGNGKKKLVIREREYDALSVHGLKTMVSVVVAVVGVIAAVLTAYYTAEASQNRRIAEQQNQIIGVTTKVESDEKNLTKTLQKFDATLIEQRKILDDTKQAVTRIDTRQQILVDEVEKISDKLDKRNP